MLTRLGVAVVGLILLGIGVTPSPSPVAATTLPPAAKLVGLKAGYDITSTRVAFRSSDSSIIAPTRAGAPAGRVIEEKPIVQRVTETIHVESEVIAARDGSVTVRSVTTGNGVQRTDEIPALVEDIVGTLPARPQGGAYRRVTRDGDLEITHTGRVVRGWLDETLTEVTSKGEPLLKLQTKRIADPSLRTPVPDTGDDQGIWLLPQLVGRKDHVGGLRLPAFDTASVTVNDQPVQAMIAAVDFGDCHRTVQARIRTYDQAFANLATSHNRYRLCGRYTDSSESEYSWYLQSSTAEADFFNWAVEWTDDDWNEVEWDYAKGTGTAQTFGVFPLGEYQYWRNKTDSSFRLYLDHSKRWHYDKINVFHVGAEQWQFWKDEQFSDGQVQSSFNKTSWDYCWYIVGDGEPDNEYCTP